MKNRHWSAALIVSGLLSLGCQPPAADTVPAPTITMPPSSNTTGGITSETPVAESPAAPAEPKADSGAIKLPPPAEPKVEAEAPKAEAPKAEAPKADAPKAEAPKAEEAKPDAPKAEEAKSE
jgi:hypothetical protein